MTGTRLALCAAVVCCACVALYSARSAGGAPAGSDAFGWRGTLLVQLRVSDLDRAVAFYTDTMGFTLERRNDELQWARVKPGIPGVTIGLGVGEPTGSGSASLNFGVEDIERARAVLEARGVRFLGPTITVPGTVMLADLTDPDGNRIRIAQDITAR